MTMKGTEMTETITCVYCGHAYEPGTPTSRHERLTAHIKICEKHPMREAEAKIRLLRDALVGLVGASTAAELDAIEAGMRMAPAPEADKAVAINAIHALRSTL